VSVLHSLTRLGYARIKAAFTPTELAAADHETETLIANWVTGELADADFWTWQPSDRASPVLYRIHNLERRSPAVAALIVSGTLTRLAEAIFAGPCKPTACALTLKMEGCGLAVPWHRDPIETPPNSFYNFSIYLDGSNAANGALQVVPSSHIQPDLNWSSESTPHGAVCVEADPTDILIHDVQLLHGSPACRQNKRRRAIVVEFQRAEKGADRRAE
jgi:phytanoyl-CoA hydroxylase